MKWFQHYVAIEKIYLEVRDNPGDTKRTKIETAAFSLMELVWEKLSDADKQSLLDRAGPHPSEYSCESTKKPPSKSKSTSSKPSASKSGASKDQ